MTPLPAPRLVPLRPAQDGTAVRLDCDSCPVRGHACADCVVALMIGPPCDLTDTEVNALDALAEGGLVPPLRLLPVVTGGDRRRR